MSNRPFATHYFAAGSKDPAAKGHAASEEGAIRASVVRVFLRQWVSAEIYEDGVLIYSVVRHGRTITIHLGRAQLLRSAA